MKRFLITYTIPLLLAIIACCTSSDAYSQDRSGGAADSENAAGDGGDPDSENGDGASEHDFDIDMMGSYDTLRCLNGVNESDSIYIPFKNAGNNTLQSLEYFYRYNSAVYGPFTWSGFVETDEVGYLPVNGTLEPNFTSYNFSLYTQNPNGVADEDPTNDTVEVMVINSEIPQLHSGIIESRICDGDSITLGTQLPSQYQFVWDNGNPQRLREVTQEGVYTVEAFNGDSCSSTAVYEIIHHLSPDSLIAGTIEYCENESSVLSTDPSFEEITWQGNGSAAFETFTAHSSGSVNVSVVDSNQCEYTETVTVDVLPLPDVSLPGDIDICRGESDVLDPVLGSNTFGVQLEWHDGHNGVSRTVSEGGEYVLRSTGINGCVTYDTTQVIINELPEFSIVGPSVICRGQTLNIGVNRAFPVYEWSSGHTNAFPDISGGGIYKVTVTDKNGCKNTAQKEVRESVPEFDLGGDTVLCDGDALFFNLEGKGVSFKWDDRSQSASRAITNGGVYSVSVINDDQCEFADTISISEKQLPKAHFDFEKQDLQVQFFNRSDEADEYVWEFGDGSDSKVENPIHQYLNPGSYQVTLSAGNICGISVKQFQVEPGISGVEENEFNSRVSLYPNPAGLSDMVYVEFTDLDDREIELILHNSIGQQMMMQRVVPTGGLHREPLRISHLASGVYFLTFIVDSEYKASEKIIIGR